MKQLLLSLLLLATIITTSQPVAGAFKAPTRADVLVSRMLLTQNQTKVAAYDTELGHRDANQTWKACRTRFKNWLKHNQLQATIVMTLGGVALGLLIYKFFPYGTSTSATGQLVPVSTTGTLVPFVHQTCPIATQTPLPLSTALVPVNPSCGTLVPVVHPTCPIDLQTTLPLSADTMLKAQANSNRMLQFLASKNTHCTALVPVVHQTNPIATPTTQLPSIDSFLQSQRLWSGMLQFLSRYNNKNVTIN